MSTEIKIPVLGESITEATIASWLKKEGDSVQEDEVVAELETDKVTVELRAPVSGVLKSLNVNVGDTVTIGTVVGAVEEGAASVAAPASLQKTPDPVMPPSEKREAVPSSSSSAQVQSASVQGSVAMPSAQRLAHEASFPLRDVTAPTGKGGRILKEDVQKSLSTLTTSPSALASSVVPTQDVGREERVRMSSLRKTIARRLKEAQNTAAILTTFNEVDMSAILALRSSYKEMFEKKHAIKLGFMGFFVRACVVALQEIPSVNAQIEDDTLVYKNYYNIGIAVGTKKGLVVPVLREAQEMSIAQIEEAIAALGKKARDGALTLPDLQGGTFTISNGGVYGSLMSTPILSAPQSGVLGMHKIQERPMAIGGQVEIRPMMYVALSYDHRVVDGQQAVTFLVRVKECLEDPQRFILDL